MTRTHVRSEEGFRRYFAMIPNIVFDDERLTLHDRALYNYYVRVCGQDGRCYKSRESIAMATGMSVRSIAPSRKRLDDLGYITVRESDRSPVVVQIVDIWDANMAAYTPEGGGQIGSGGAQIGSPKKNPLKKRSDPDGEGVGILAGDTPAPPEADQRPERPERRPELHRKIDIDL